MNSSKYYLNCQDFRYYVARMMCRLLELFYLSQNLLGDVFDPIEIW